MQLLIKSEPAAVILFCYITLIELIAYNSIVYPATKMFLSITKLNSNKIDKDYTDYYKADHIRA